MRNRKHANLREGLVGAWCAGHSSFGPLVKDYSGNGSHGKLTNGAVWTPSDGRGSIRLDGTDDYVDLGDSLTLPSSLTALTQGTVSAWIYPVVIDANGPVIVGVGENDDGGTVKMWWLRVQTIETGKLQVFFREADRQVRAATTTITVGAWWHTVVTSDGNAWSLYVNGISQALTVPIANTGAWWGDLTGSPNSFHIGRIPRGTGNLGLANAFIDDVLVYDRPILPSEVALLYSLGPNWLTQRRRSWHILAAPSQLVGSDTGAIQQQWANPFGAIQTQWVR